ncbi:putative metalloprotease with PDZ domain [Algoriphagus iocasae]|uniref:Putative metalloprotease with PDZ domain n=1 Tax=Algoriphagus iocasae TaxID=1836499 RepID=A0A841MK76_9BACT|nr:M61 family metallopeptidase [Algoriphagus iocasae]MBB6325877.1 putative metalloprotease with PDZ domain [Algoriphagus iocasae]
MCKYTISCPNPASQFLQIQLELTAPSDGPISLQLPAWRAGRYQLANYAQFLRNFRVQNETGEKIHWRKISKDCWTFEAKKNQKYLINYEFFCSRMDAGGAWIDDQQVSINFINCCFEVKGLENSPINIQADLPSFKQHVCTIPVNPAGSWTAENFQMLADSTFLASNSLSHFDYKVGDANFHIWIQGEIHFDTELFIERFKKFTASQIQDFGEFPEKTYHFIFQLLPYRHYHGVEHQKGTVITFGPAESLSDPNQMEELLGVSSHELYHAWNVCRIRPQELLPYDFSKENYTKAGWMLEGITTFMGDYYLMKSGVFSLETFLIQIENTLKKEIANQGWKNQTILESSYDLWLDGYQQGIPDRKVNIYSHGSLICFCLDIMLLERGSSFTSVMRATWNKFGKPKFGYTNESFWETLISHSTDSGIFEDFYRRFISGNEDLIPFFSEKIKSLGLKLELNENSDQLANSLGILTSDNKIIKIHQDSPAFVDLMIGDQVQFQLTENKINLAVSRINGFMHKYSYDLGSGFFPEPKIKIENETEFRVKWMK